MSTFIQSAGSTSARPVVLALRDRPKSASNTVPCRGKFACVAIGAALVSAAIFPLHAAKPAKQTPSDSAPILMSRTGGGQWANVKELEQAATKGNPKAQAQLGEMLLRGEGIAKNEGRAVPLLEAAARAGSGAAAFRVGMLLANGEAGVARDPVRALAYFRAAAAGGEKEAFFNIGAAYGSARGVKRDYGEALGWLIVARKRGADANAETSLRAQIKAQPSWIARGERRATEIEREFAGKKVTDFLPPPAPLDTIVSEPKPTNSLAPAAPVPATPPMSTDSLKPADLLKLFEPPKPPPIQPPEL